MSTKFSAEVQVTPGTFAVRFYVAAAPLRQGRRFGDTTPPIDGWAAFKDTTYSVPDAMRALFGDEEHGQIHRIELISRTCVTPEEAGAEMWPEVARLLCQPGATLLRGEMPADLAAYAARERELAEAGAKNPGLASDLADA